MEVSMALSRKTFLRVLGGGIVVAAGAAVAVPRLDAMPASAVEGWRGPGPEEADPRRRALAWALLAPNPHNLQSWSVDLSQPGAIVLFADRTRLLPQTDPFSRQILIGHGCFLEILSMAAAADGYRADVALFPGGEWRLDRPVARIVFVKQPGIAVDPLFVEVPRRRTVKGKYEARTLDASHKVALFAGYGAPALPLAIADEPGRVDRLRALAVAGSELEMNTARTHKESIDVARIGAAEIAAHRDGISLKGPMIWALRQTGQMTPEKAMTPGTLAWNGGRDYALGGYGSAQTLQEYPEMAELRAAMHRETGTPDGAILQMFFRLGYAGDPGPSPRRALQSFVTV
ncbi:MAG: twin-arginine translocation pathway signal protein [Alphaproteobacteria bacterium]|nr:twin-arginine translocation pathway signal protein [Alphaproteobacteria bacterium]